MSEGDSTQGVDSLNDFLLLLRQYAQGDAGALLDKVWSTFGEQLEPMSLSSDEQEHSVVLSEACRSLLSRPENGQVLIPREV
jgi:hypothetical protein